LFEGSGIAILMLAVYIWPLLSPYHLAIYHDPFSVSTVAAGLAIDLALASLLFGLALAGLDRYRPEQSGVLWALVVALSVFKSINFAIFLCNFYRANLPWSFAFRLGFFFVALGAAILLAKFSPALLRRSVRTVRVGLAIFGCCICWMLPQLASTAIRARAPEASAFERAIDPPPSPQPRIIWILMDELSYDQVFEHRQPDVKLPHFDELKQESVVFSDVRPVGYFTERILPSLFIGREVDDIRSSLRKDLFIHDAEAAQWERFDQQASIFGEAERAGWTTGVAGWYNPYCEILRDVLDSCSWQSADPFLRLHFEGAPAIVDAAALPFDSLLWRFGISETRPDVLRREHLQNAEDLAQAADALIRKESVGFVFLHLPVPHPPGIYDRKTKTLGAKGTYLDSLVLADETLGRLRDEIARTAAAARTTVVISSDHSWRVDMWRLDPEWTPEEERASSGRFDPRPVLLIHFPREDRGETRTEPFPELGIHGILGAMLKGEIGSQGDLDRWLDGHEKASGQDLTENRH
jgi:hypothetical protein